MTKLIIQIPCYNEEESLGITLSALPRNMDGIETVEWLIIDDGCTDRTVEIGKTYGADHIIRLSKHQGLARAFMAGLDASLKAGADIIVNLDADNQYCAEDIPKLIAPIQSGKAEISIGIRPFSEIRHLSVIKRLLHKLGSSTVRLVSKTDISDAPSGFRAMSRDAAMRLNVFNEYTYTLETIIQAGQKGMAIASVPIRVNETLRPSRLIKNISDYVMRSISTIVRIFMTYRPFRFFAIPGIVSFSLGLLVSFRFLYLYLSGHGSVHIQSLILMALLLGGGFFLGVIGLLADLISVNRKLLENIVWRVQKLEEKLEKKKRDYV
jgi:glycosyltransferase involved in cell wall biosynthesis